MGRHVMSIARCLIATVAIAGFGVRFGSAQPAGSPGPPPVPRADAMKDLNLTPDQRTRLKELGHRTREKLKQLGAAMMKAREELEKVYNAYPLDDGKARQLNTQINSLQRSTLDLHYRAEQELRKILTADQFTKLRANMASRWKNRVPRDRPGYRDRGNQ
jgi:Spy/CpxP family protein refolding chaperone